MPSSLFWLVVAFALGLLALLALAGYALVGLFMAAVTVWAARAAESPIARRQTDATLKRACNGLPFCSCD